MHICIFDMSNLLYRSFYGEVGSHQDDTAVSFAHHKSLMSINKFFKQLKPDMTIAAFDRPNNWRKMRTTTEDAVSPLVYKGHRREGMTPKQQLVFNKFINSVGELEDMLRSQTRIITLAADGLEADDLIAGCVQTFDESHQITIVSGDTDFIQLLRHPNVSLLDPRSSTYRTLDEWNGDADLFIFHKCCKGDATDNVMRIFPKVYKTKVLEYYTDELKRTNAFDETWMLAGRPIHPGTLFEENKLLMDLTAQPADIRELINRTIEEELAREKTYNQMSFWRFAGKHGLRKIAEDSASFTRLFNTHP